MNFFLACHLPMLKFSVLCFSQQQQFTIVSSVDMTQITSFYTFLHLLKFNRFFSSSPIFRRTFSLKKRSVHDTFSFSLIYMLQRSQISFTRFTFPLQKREWNRYIFNNTKFMIEVRTFCNTPNLTFRMKVFSYSLDKLYRYV